MAIDMGVKGILFVAHIGNCKGCRRDHEYHFPLRAEMKDGGSCASAIRAGGSLECARDPGGGDYR